MWSTESPFEVQKSAPIQQLQCASSYANFLNPSMMWQMYIQSSPHNHSAPIKTWDEDFKDEKQQSLHNFLPIFLVSFVALTSGV